MFLFEKHLPAFEDNNLGELIDDLEVQAYLVLASESEHYLVDEVVDADAVLVRLLEVFVLLDHLASVDVDVGSALVDLVRLLFPHLLDDLLHALVNLLVHAVVLLVHVLLRPVDVLLAEELLLWVTLLLDGEHFIGTRLLS